MNLIIKEYLHYLKFLLLDKGLRAGHNPGQIRDTGRRPVGRAPLLGFGGAARRRYEAAVRRVAALGFTYRSTMEILQAETGTQILDRLRVLLDQPPNSPAANAVLGVVERPTVCLSEAFNLYVKKIAVSELAGKSDEQRGNWLKVKKRALTNFIDLIGDKAISDVTREDALKLYNMWAARIAPIDEHGKGGKPPTAPPPETATSATCASFSKNITSISSAYSTQSLRLTSCSSTTNSKKPGSGHRFPPNGSRAASYGRAVWNR
jgi:hypothetical protein